MTLPSSGPLSIEQIMQEYLGVKPIDFSQYYSGNNTTYVSPDNIDFIPTTGALQFDDFYGATKGLTNSGYICGGIYTGTVYSTAIRKVRIDFGTIPIESATSISLSANRFDAASVSGYRSAYIAGGSTGSLASNTVDKLRFVSETLSLTSFDLTVAGYVHSVSTGIHNKFNGYICGGVFIYSPTYTIRRISYNTDTYLQLGTSLNIGSGNAAGLCSSSNGYLCGGDEASVWKAFQTSSTNNIVKLNYATETSSSISDLNYDRSSPAGLGKSCSSSHGYVIGGESYGNGPAGFLSDQFEKVVFSSDTIIDIATSLPIAVKAPSDIDLGNLGIVGYGGDGVYPTNPTTYNYLINFATDAIITTVSYNAELARYGAVGAAPVRA